MKRVIQLALLTGLLTGTVAFPATIRMNLPQTDLTGIPDYVSGWFDYNFDLGTYEDWSFVVTNYPRSGAVQSILTPSTSTLIRGSDLRLDLGFGVSGFEYTLSLLYGLPGGTFSWQSMPLQPDRTAVPFAILGGGSAEAQSFVSGGSYGSFGQLITYTFYRAFYATGTLTAVPEPVPGLMVLFSAAALCLVRRRRPEQNK